ncbi:MAG: fliQ1 [Herminiimonas sp.]|nr:fliQ1 [Herminiimonas sp.]
MSADIAMMLTARTLWTALLVAAPVLLLALVIGLLISIVQVVTQVQEMSLTFVPKLLGTVAMLAFLGPWMMKQITSFASWAIGSIPSYI